MRLISIVDALCRTVPAALTACRGFVYPPSCLFCGTVLAGDVQPVMICHGCVRSLHLLEADCHAAHLAHVWFDRARSLFAYEGRVRDMLHAFKYGDRFDVVGPLARMLADEARAMGIYDRLVPVPLHRARLAARGFNQSALLTRAMSPRLDVRYELDALVRVRDPGAQVGRERAERLAAVRGIFAVRNTAAIRGRRIMLIDDVLTTGATVNECARTLTKAGARSVDVLTVARTL